MYLFCGSGSPNKTVYFVKMSCFYEILIIHTGSQAMKKSCKTYMRES